MSHDDTISIRSRECGSGGAVISHISIYTYQYIYTVAYNHRRTLIHTHKRKHTDTLTTHPCCIFCIITLSPEVIYKRFYHFLFFSFVCADDISNLKRKYNITNQSSKQTSLNKRLMKNMIKYNRNCYFKIDEPINFNL